MHDSYMLIYVLACSPMYVGTLFKWLLVSPRENIYARQFVHAPSCAWARVTETSKDEGVLLLLRVKHRCLGLRDYKYYLHHALYLMQISFACNLIPLGDRLDSAPVVDFLGKDAVGLNGLCYLLWCLHEYYHELFFYTKGSPRFHWNQLASHRV